MMGAALSAYALLGVAWAGYWGAVPVRFRRDFLLLVSGGYLLITAPLPTLFLLALAVLSYYLPRRVAPAPLIVSGVVVLLGYKYLPWPVHLLGFSYYMFSVLHYLIERGQGNEAVLRLGLREYLAYLYFLPKFISGPIERCQRFGIGETRPIPASQLYGLLRSTGGLVKKMVLVPPLAAWSQTLVAVDHSPSRRELWLALYAYALYLYLDFSAYTDIAIGVARLFGVRLMENFRYPYGQRNLQQFWNTWHISLTSWIRDYVFIPLGKQLCRVYRDPVRQFLPLTFVTMTVTMAMVGVWHGETLNYLLWGLYHGLGLFLVKAFDFWLLRRHQPWRQRLRASRLAAVIGAVLTFHFVTLGWLLFACEPVRALTLAGTLLGFGG